MKGTATVLRIIINVIGIIMIVLGLLFWTDNATALIPVHMLLGIVLVLLLWVMAGLALAARANPLLAVVAFVWGLIVPILGATQTQILPFDGHWIIQVLHLLVGLTAIALANILARQITTGGATRQPGASPA